MATFGHFPVAAFIYGLAVDDLEIPGKSGICRHRDFRVRTWTQ